MNTSAEFEQLLQEGLDCSKLWVVQEFIRGKVGSISIACRKGKVFGIYNSSKHVSLGGGLGPSAIRRLESDPTLDAIARRVATAAEITGITGFDWMQAGPGDYRVIDPHLGRCTTTSALGFLGGIDMGRVLHSSLLGGKPEPPQEDNGKIVWMMPQTIVLIFQGQFFKSWRQASLFRPDVQMFWCAPGKWRMFSLLCCEYIVAQTRMLLGRWFGK